MCKAAATEVLYELHNLTLTSCTLHIPWQTRPLPQKFSFVQPVLVFSSPSPNKTEERPNLGFFAAQFEVLGVFSMP